MGTTGGSPASWHLFEQVHQIIGGFSINNVEELIEESFEGKCYLFNLHDQNCRHI